MSLLSDLSSKQLALGGALIAGVAYLRTSDDEPADNAAEDTPDQRRRRLRALARMRQSQEREIDPDFLKQQQEEAAEPDNVSRADRRSPAQIINEYQDKLPDDAEWENRVEYDPVTGEPYNPVQLAWLATNVLPNQEGFGEVPDDSDSSGDDSNSDSSE